MPSVSLPTASLERSADGTPFSGEYQDVYHSTQGGLAQSRHVFLAGNALPERWRGRDCFVILETGFGLGLNFLAAWEAWRSDPARSRRLHFLSVESRPFARRDLAEALGTEHELAPLASELVAAWPPPVAGFHRLHFDGGDVILTLLFGAARSLLPELEARVDAFFLDGFSPARNPEIWSPEVVRELARLAAPGATLATWTVAGGVRAALADAGFRLEKRRGFGTKREMLAGSRGDAAQAPRSPRHAIVVGGGLAGSLAAERLASRDWEVDVVDAREQRNVAAVGLVRPIANLRDALNARLSRAAFFYALQHYAALPGLEWNACGVLQLAEDDEELARFEAITASQAYPAELLASVDGARARERAGRDVRGGGWWFERGAVVAPASLAHASAARAGGRMRSHTARRVERIEREGADWRALDAAGRVIAEAPALVIANAADAKRLVPAARFSLASVRGQVTYVPRDPSRSIDAAVSGTGYVAPMPGGGLCIGATYGHDDAGEDVRADDHRANLARADSMLPGFSRGLDAAALAGWAGHRATVPDRLPIYGATAIEGVHAATGLGSRGLLWAPLASELLACAMEGEPLPLPRTLMGAISPKRFLS